jgi:hypothetical protein
MDIRFREEFFSERYHIFFRSKNMKKNLSFVLILFTITACNKIPKEEKDNGLPANIVSANTDYATGSLSKISLPGFNVNNLLKGAVGSDIGIRSYNGLVYVLNKYGADNIQIVDPNQNFSIVKEKSTGAGSNPHDICVINNNKAYITRYDSKELWIVDPSTLEKLSPTGEISLESYAPSGANGVPCMDRMYFDSARSLLYVSLQRLASWSPSDYSSVIVINTNTDSIVKEIKLTWTTSGTDYFAKNPYTDFVNIPSSAWQPAVSDAHDHLFISCVGNFGYSYAEDGGIIAIDLSDQTCEEGYVLSEAVIHSEITSLLYRNSSIYIIQQNSSQANTLHKCLLSDLSDTTVYATAGSFPTMALYPSGLLFMCDRSSTAPGLRIFDTTNGDSQISISPLITDLPPVDIAVVQ